MANPYISIPKTLSAEGGFNRDLGDGAGMTYRGLTEVYDADWGGWEYLREWIQKNGYPKEETIFPELEASAIAYYRSHYWPLVQGDQLTSQEMADFVFDFTVNSGKARKQINIAINKALGNKVVPEENTLGSDSVAYLNQYPAKIYPYIVEQRKTYLQSLSSWESFGKGWLNRIASFPSTIIDSIAGGDEQKKKSSNTLQSR